jgi:hypothetical protein
MMRIGSIIQKFVVAALSVMVVGSGLTLAAADKHSVLYSGGPLYSTAGTYRDTIRASGFTTIVLWTLHIYGDGDLVLNDMKLVDNGVYVGRSAWPSEVAAFKTGTTSVNRIEISIGSWGVADFETIKSLIAAEGTGQTSSLYKNFLALKNAIPSLDAVSYDDESCYDVSSSVALAVMLKDMGYKNITLCPYTRSSYWKGVYDNVNSQRPGTVDRVYLQCYAGGASNNPGTWNGYFSGLKVSPGLWCYSNGQTPAQVETKMSAWWGNYDIAGGFMWFLDDMIPHLSTYPVAAYGYAINDALAFHTHAGEVVTLFQNINYGGWLADFGEGAYTAADIVAAGGLDNDASSVIVKPGYKVTFFENDNFQGASLVKTAKDSTIVDDGWNDRLSSMMIEAVPTLNIHVPMNENGGSVAGDISGNSFKGQLMNMGADNWVAGKQCYGLAFEGINDYLLFSGYKGVSGFTNRTCSAWIKTTVTRPSNIIVWGAPLNGASWMFRTGSLGNLEVGVWGGYIRGNTMINDGQWHHVAAVLSNDGTPAVGDIDLYVDGVLEANPYVSSAQSIGTSDMSDVLMGTRIDGFVPSDSFNGLMDEIVIYNMALTDSEIFALYESMALTSDMEPDGDVDLADYSALAKAWQSANTGLADLTCDGFVDIDDFMILAEEWLDAI